jgi:hypothetical protein
MMLECYTDDDMVLNALNGHIRCIPLYLSKTVLPHLVVLATGHKPVPPSHR